MNEADVSALKKQLSDVRYFDSPKCFGKRLYNYADDLELFEALEQNDDQDQVRVVHCVEMME